jgi:hypothetical protein
MLSAQQTSAMERIVSADQVQQLNAYLSSDSASADTSSSIIRSTKNGNHNAAPLSVVTSSKPTAGKEKQQPSSSSSNSNLRTPTRTTNTGKQNAAAAAESSSSPPPRSSKIQSSLLFKKESAREVNGSGTPANPLHHQTVAQHKQDCHFHKSTTNRIRRPQSVSSALIEAARVPPSPPPKYPPLPPAAGVNSFSKDRKNYEHIEQRDHISTDSHTLQPRSTRNEDSHSTPFKEMLNLASSQSRQMLRSSNRNAANVNDVIKQRNGGSSGVAVLIKQSIDGEIATCSDIFRSKGKANALPATGAGRSSAQMNENNTRGRKYEAVHLKDQLDFENNSYPAPPQIGIAARAKQSRAGVQDKNTSHAFDFLEKSTVNPL